MDLPQMNPPQKKILTPAEIQAYYSRLKSPKRIFEMCKDREVVPVFLGGFYGTRPNSVQFLEISLILSKTARLLFTALSSTGRIRRCYPMI